MTRPVRRTQNSSDRRNDWQWQQLRRRFKADCKTRNALCHICVGRGDIENAEIDYAAPALAANAFEADHIRGWNQYPHLRYEWRNLAAAHSRCNRQRRDETVVVQQVWVKPDW